jgi:hypothetical protein
VCCLSVQCTVHTVLQYNETAVSWKPFRIRHMYIYTSSQNTDLSSWDNPVLLTNFIAMRVIFILINMTFKDNYLNIPMPSTKHKLANYKSCSKNSIAWVHEQTIPTDRPPLVSEVSANFCRQWGVAWSAQRIPIAVILVF